MPTLSMSMLGLPDQTNGFYLPVRLRLDADGKSLVAFYGLRIFLGPLTPNAPNQNPVLTGIFTVPSADAGADENMALDDANPPTCTRATSWRCARSSRPRAPRRTSSSTAIRARRRRAPSTRRCASRGTRPRANSPTTTTGNDKPDTTLKLDKHQPASGATIDLWVVAQDERGGSDVLHRTLLFQ